MAESKSDIQAATDSLIKQQEIPPEPSLNSLSSTEFDKWIEHFYKECGREVTLAYTTLNQMKNWAIAIVAAFASAVVALGKPAQTEQPSTILHIGLYSAAVFAYVFNLRFFIRSILCYINLIRWNTLQNKIISVYLIPNPLRENLTREEAKQALRTNIEDYYHLWRSPLNRRDQLRHNLKLGFALVLALPLFFVIIWTVELWHLYPVRGLLWFLIGTTAIEFTDFASDGYFDTPERAKKRKQRSNRQLFPIPVSKGWYFVSWSLNLGLSIIIGSWPAIESTFKHWVSALFC